MSMYVCMRVCINLENHIYIYIHIVHGHPPEIRAISLLVHSNYSSKMKKILLDNYIYIQPGNCMYIDICMYMNIDIHLCMYKMTSMCSSHDIRYHTEHIKTNILSLNCYNQY